MSNIPQTPQIQMTQQGQGSLLTIIAGVAAIVVTQLGTSFSSQAGVSQVRDNQLIIVQDIKTVSEANRALNERIVKLSEENQRLNERELEMAKQAEVRQTKILEKLEKLK
jgi:lysyl-tRNA synthetase class II